MMNLPFRHPGYQQARALSKTAPECGRLVQISAPSGFTCPIYRRENMRRKTTILLALIMAVMPLSLAFAGGAGGVLFGIQQFDPQFASFDAQARYVGGFGYGVSRSGLRTGGFGMAFYSDSQFGDFSGGVGGLINGQELRFGPFTAAVDILTGVGGLSMNEQGYFVVFGEIDVELGVAVSPWMQVTAYGGMQGMANVAPGRPFMDALWYTPVLGVRLAWGSFSNSR
jgi:hypothetical protein